MGGATIKEIFTFHFSTIRIFYHNMHYCNTKLKFQQLQMSTYKVLHNLPDYFLSYSLKTIFLNALKSILLSFKALPKWYLLLTFPCRRPLSPVSTLCHKYTSIMAFTDHVVILKHCLKFPPLGGGHIPWGHKVFLFHLWIVSLVTKIKIYNGWGLDQSVLKMFTCWF